MRLLALGALSLLATCCACDGSSGAGPRTAPTTPAGVVDGTSYALIQASDGKTVTWDPVAFRGNACKAGLSEGDSYQRLFAACYSNPDTTLRTAPLDPATKVIVWPGTDPKRTVDAGGLPQEIGAGAANDIPATYRVWRIAISAGRVVAVEQARI